MSSERLWLEMTIQKLKADLEDRAQEVFADECLRLSTEGCYCCEVWPVGEDGPCERCLALANAAEMIRDLVQQAGEAYGAGRLDGQLEAN